MGSHRIEKINSLLKEVISDVILKEVKNPHLPPLITITRVETSKDLRHARVYVSVIGDETKKAMAIGALQSAAGFIATHASKQMVIRYFPDLKFFIDDSVEKQMKINELIIKIQEEREGRGAETVE